MSSSYGGSQLVRCVQCQQSFTQTHWRLHGHNPDQATCNAQLCRRKAVGHRYTGGIPQLLCGGHLLEAQRNGGQVTFVDGRICHVCDGHGQVHAQEIRVDSPGGEWRPCPECLGTGYDPSLRSQVASQGSQEGKPPTPRPNRQESLGGGRAKAAEERDARRRWFDREIAPLADSLPDAQTSGTPPRGVERTPFVPPSQRQPTSGSRGIPGSPGPRLTPGSRSEDIRAFERAFGRRRRGRRRGNLAGVLAFAGIAVLAGAVTGVLFVDPMLPDAAAETMDSVQQWVSERFAR